jgi:Zn-dependent protease with chaperone function
MYRSNRAARIFLFIFIIGPIAIFLFGFIVMWLWNNALVPVLHISEVTFWAYWYYPRSFSEVFPAVAAVDVPPGEADGVRGCSRNGIQ